MKKNLLPILLFFFFGALFSVFYLVSSSDSENKQIQTGKNPAKRVSLLAKKPTLGTISVNLYSTADSSVDSSHPTSNYGSSSTIATGWYDATAPNPDQALRLLLKFDLSAIPSNATVNSATLGLYLWWGTGTPSPNALTAGQAASSWTELGVNWNNRPGHYTNVNASVSTTQGWKTFNVKPIVTEWIAGSKANHGLIVMASESGGYWYRYFNSREASSNKPYLLVNYSIPDTTPPTISNITTSDLTKNSVKITWTTNEAASSIVDYGPTNTYGTSFGEINLFTNHSVPLSNLSAGQTYHFRVRSKDAANNEAVSSDNTFTTASDTAPGTGTNTSTNTTTGSNTSTQPTTETATPQPQAATAAAKLSAAKTGKTISTPSAGTKTEKHSDSKIAGIKTPIFLTIAVLILLLVGAAIYIFKFHPELFGKKSPNIQIENTPKENNP